MITASKATFTKTPPKRSNTSAHTQPGKKQTRHKISPNGYTINSSPIPPRNPLLTTQNIHAIMCKHSSSATKHRGVEQLEARRAHNPEVVGSSPASATKELTRYLLRIPGFLRLCGGFWCEKLGYWKAGFCVSLIVSLIRLPPL